VDHAAAAALRARCAILFSDIMTPLQGMGITLDFSPGPVVKDPIRTDAQIDELRSWCPHETSVHAGEQFVSCAQCAA